MLGFSCSIWAPNSNISQHEAYSPLAISFSHRAKVTWLTTVSHLTMQKDYQFVGLLSGGGSFLTIALLQQTLHHEGLLTPRLCALRYSACKVLLSFSLSLFSRCTPNYTCGKMDAFWLFSKEVFHLLPLILSLLRFSNSVCSTVGYWIYIYCVLSVAYAQVSPRLQSSKMITLWAVVIKNGLWGEKSTWQPFPQIIEEASKLCCHDSATLHQWSGERNSLIKHNFSSQPRSGKLLKICGYCNKYIKARVT